MAAQNRARTHTQLHGYRQAGIGRYVFSAVMDERTTDICRMMDGKIFGVEDSLRSYEAVEADSRFDAIKDHQPWVRSRRSRDEGVESDLFLRQRDGQEVLVGQVVRSSRQVDRPGHFQSTMDSGTLASFGICQPPLHGMCRSTIQPL